MLNLLQANQLSLGDLLPKSVMEKIRLSGRATTYSDRQLIQQRGDEKMAFSIVESGQVLAGNIGADGAFLTTTLFKPGEFYGEFTLLAGLPRSQSLWAMGETVVNHVSGAAFHALFNNEPDFPRALLIISLRRIHFLVEFLDAQKRWPMPVRIAHILLTSVPDKASTPRQEISCRQEDIAFILGVSRVAIGKALKSLESEGLIETGYGSIVLPDAPRLAAWLENHRQLVAIAPPSVLPPINS